MLFANLNVLSFSPVSPRYGMEVRCKLVLFCWTRTTFSQGRNV